MMREAVGMNSGCADELAALLYWGSSMRAPKPDADGSDARFGGNDAITPKGLSRRAREQS